MILLRSSSYGGLFLYFRIKTKTGLRMRGQLVPIDVVFLLMTSNQPSSQERTSKIQTVWSRLNDS